MTDTSISNAPSRGSAPSPGDAARLAEILVTLARHGAITTVRSRSPRAFPVALRRSFAELGPVFIKLGQVIASTPGLFSATLADEMRRLLDHVRPEPFLRVRRVIERELGGTLDELFATFDPEPVAAASIAQVHRAVLPNGSAVAVKVRRPHLRGRIERDLRLLRVVAAVVDHSGRAAAVINAPAIVDDLTATLREELDFRREAAVMEEFAANLRAGSCAAEVVVPTPVPGMVGERVLVMSFVEGTAIDDAAALRAAGHDLEAIVRTAVRAWVEGALVHGLFHGDVHAGNLFVTPDGKIAFLDFGIMGHLDERAQRVLRHTVPAVLIEGDFRAVVEATFALGAARPAHDTVDVETATADVRGLLAPLADKPLGDIAYGEMLDDLFRVAATYGVRLPRELVLVAKQLLYFERYARALAPRYRLLADPRIVEHVMTVNAEITDVTAPRRRLPRPAAVEEDNAVRVPRTSEVQFAWAGDDGRADLTRLASKAKRAQWNATTDIDWSIEVDPQQTGAGFAGYLPLIAAESFGRFTERQRAEAAHHFNAWITSQFLHGEQGALLATAKLVAEVPWAEAKQYGATQVMDEARHVEVYARYLDEKLELAYPVNDNLRQLLQLVIADPRWDVTYLGMQIIVEGIALAAFGLIHQYSDEPLVKQITRYVMADEARHVAFGALSLAGLYDEMSAAEREEREDFVVEAAWLMRERFLAEEVWERLGIPLSDGLRDSARSPMLQLFQRILFAKITPNLRRIGLLSDRLTGELIRIGAMPPEL